MQALCRQHSTPTGAPRDRYGPRRDPCATLALEPATGPTRVAATYAALCIPRWIATLADDLAELTRTMPSMALSWRLVAGCDGWLQKFSGVVRLVGSGGGNR